jgi:bidirectional [NiFe] hydrogenase diaphorase subunit
MTDTELQEMADAERQRQTGLRCRIGCCVSSGCISGGSSAVLESLQRDAKTRGLTESIEVVPVGCLGPCSLGTLVRLETPGGPERLFERVTPELTPALLAEATEKPGAAKAHELAPDGPFFRRQQKIVLENCGAINPESVDEYVARDGYAALAKVLEESTPPQVCDEITRSGLRGRGGAGYPTGVKWNLVRKAAHHRKYVIANGDEGDPGAYMDRAVMESDPHRVLEGMAIAAYAVGASHGYIYVRGEYPVAVNRLGKAVKDATRRGLLGRDILGTSFSFHVEIRIGAGAFVCGEETALIASIEGNRGQPRPRPPYPAEAGLFGAPTLINNVETLATIPVICRRGADWYSAIGTPTSKGTKVFALSGAVARTGLIEVPMGTTLREIVFDIGGGIPDGKKFKAVQTGGPSGGCIPEEHLDTPVDYESLVRLGSIMGSGGMIVMDETSSMVDVARFFMEFCRDESCGKCIPCRAGTVQMHHLLDKIMKGVGTMDDLALLEDLCDVVKHTSLCGLGQSAPNPVLSTLRYFRNEYVAKIGGRSRPAGPDRKPLPLVHGGAGS